jgi:endonuclease-3
MNEKEWDDTFSEMRSAVIKEGGNLPSVSTIAAEKQDPYRVLVSTLISLRTKDQVTLQASRKLFTLADTPEGMLHLPDETIAQAIFPAGFYQRKAKQIKEISQILVDKYQGKVPPSAEELMALPGVGIKTANLTLNLGYGIAAPCVDCHVHQISNRMGWVKTKTPEETERKIREVMPKKHWIPMNELLVTFGQYICTPVSPKCSLCPEEKTCPKIGVDKKR